MVTFVCESCNETLKKNQVEKHGQRCRHCRVTCVDCSRTFTLAEYVTHTSCVSEAEKYEKSLYKARPNAKANPQEAWMDLIHEAAGRKQEAPANIAEYVGRLGDLDNVPRNQKKFANFAKNSLRISNDAVLDSIWKFLQKLVAEKEQLKGQQQQPQEQGEQKQQQLQQAAAEAQQPAATNEKKHKEKKSKGNVSEKEPPAVVDVTVPKKKRKHSDTGDSDAVVEKKGDEKKLKKKRKHSEEGNNDDVAENTAAEVKKSKKEKKKEKKEKKERKDES